MTHSRFARAVVLLASLPVGAAFAQDATTAPPPANPVGLHAPTPAPDPSTQAPPQHTALYRAAPVVRLFGLPTQLQIDAPVDPSYAPMAYRTLGGQAETSADAVAEQNTTWR